MKGRRTTRSASLGKIAKNRWEDASVAVILHLDWRVDSHDARKTLAIAIGVGGVDRNR